MKGFFLLSLIILISSSYAFHDDGNNSSGSGIETAADGAGEITVNLVQTWTIPEGGLALGIDYIPFFYTDNIIAYVSGLDDVIYFMDADDGSSSYPGGWPLDSDNAYPFGLSLVPFTGDDEIHVNDFFYDAIFYKEWDTSWAEYNSLTDLMSRGMDYHVGENKIFDFYTIDTPGDYRWLVAMFTPGSGSGSTYELDCNLGSDWYGSGCCVFPMWNGNTGIAVTMYDSQWIRFFEYPGHAGEVYYSYGVLPYTADASYGITYADARNTFFHSYVIGSTYYISELAISEAALEADTWAGIKQSF